MLRKIVLVLSAMILCLTSVVPVQAEGPAWIAVSNQYTNQLMEIEFKHHPEYGSNQGLSKFDSGISQPTLADEDQERRETAELINKFKAEIAKQEYPEVAQDLQIVIKKVELGFREQDFGRAHEVPFLNASGAVFGGLRILLDDQTADERRAAVVTRIRKYAGLDPGYTPLIEILKQRVKEQMAKPGVIYPSRTEMETELGRTSSFVDGMAQLMEKHNIKGWQEPYEKLKAQLSEYDQWTKTNVLPKARSDFRLPPEEYALNLEDFGIDIPPDQLASMAHKAFTDIQAEMKPIAEKIAKQRSLPSSDYRDVIRELKQKQIIGDAILPYYQDTLKQIERIIVDHQLVTLPDRPAKIRIADAAETAAQPAPHMSPPPFLHNTGQKGEFVLPLNLPPAPGEKADKYDDFTFDAAAWTLTAHEARPGHELQFDAMLERGVSLARYRYAFNSTNVEGWGLYAEYITEPYMPLEGQLVSLDYRLLRAARAFLDPELQSGKIQPDEALHTLMQDVVQSHAMAKQEVERYTYRAPGQANSYFYGYVKLLALRQDVEAALGPKFNQKKFHDFILSQGLLPPDLMRKAVMEGFVKAQ